MHFGIVSPPVPGHLNPFGALGRELIARGHRVTLFHIPDLADRAQADGIEFIPIGKKSHPIGFLKQSLGTLGELQGLRAIRFAIGEACGTGRMLLLEAPAAMKSARIDALLVDQTEPAGGCIAERLDIPYITVCNALLMNEEAGVPPPFTPWLPLPGFAGRIRNCTGYALSDLLVVKPLRALIQEQRRAWNLSPYKKAEDSFSPLLQISQQVAGFDFPRKQLSSTFSYVGPLRRSPATAVDFPWDKLDGRPLVYASLGTLQNGKADVFRKFAQAVAELPVQLVITHGRALPETVTRSFPGKPLVVPYAPQVDVLRHTTLTLTHAGLNTALDSLSCGVPMVAVPITFEQPAIASRVVYSGTGRTLPLRKLTPKRLRSMITEILSEPSFKRNAERISTEIAAAGGVLRAADLIEDALNCRTVAAGTLDQPATPGSPQTYPAT